MQESTISRAIVRSFFKKLEDRLENDVVIAGAGPAGLVAAYYLARAGVKTTVVEKRLSIGGGIWGGGIGYNVVTLEDDEIAVEFGLQCEKMDGLYVVSSIELACALGMKARQAGAEIFNLMELEDVIFKASRVQGAVIRATTIQMAGLPVDPICVGAKCVVDATGHPAEVLRVVQKKMSDFPLDEIGEGPMHAEESEKMVVEKTGMICSGLYATGMSVCAAYNIPRMGPIFGGMLRSGRKIAEIIISDVT